MSINTLVNQPFSSDPESSFGYSRNIWEGFISGEAFTVFLRLMVQSIDACLEGNYIQFDAQTTSNCCHGLSILTREIVLSVERLDLQALKLEAIKRLENEDSVEEGLHFLKNLPGSLIDLVSLRLLTFIVEIDSRKGRRTIPRKLEEIGSVGAGFCKKIVKMLQRTFSNVIANGYTNYLQEIADNLWLERLPVKVWGKYIQKDFLRSDKRGVLYASCLFSMQISLAYLAQSGALIAIVNDLIDPSSMEVKGRYVCLLKNDGTGQLTPLSSEQIAVIKESRKEPVIVFGGYVFSETLDLKKLSLKMRPWVYQVPSLILACDVYYPQFPKVADDTGFNSNPILPEEDFLRKIINNHSKIRGVSAEAPTLFCLSHIFLANSHQLLSSSREGETLAFPSCFIPCEAASFCSQKHN